MVRIIWSYCFVLLFIVFVVLSIIKLFPDYVPITNADNLLQIWITTNGVLMGFVVLFLLNYYLQLWTYRIPCFNGFLNPNTILKIVKNF